MTAKQKIENLTHAWYGFAVVSALVSLFWNGIGFFSLLSRAISLIASPVVAWFLGRALAKKSSLTRTLLVLFSAVMTVLGVLGVARFGWAFFQTWSFQYVLAAGWASAGTYMYGRSFRTLTDDSVKAYVGS